PRISDRPSHFADIDHGDAPRRCCCCYHTSHCSGDECPLGPGQTLLVNAALMADDAVTQPPWLVDIELEPLPQTTTRERGAALLEEKEGGGRLMTGSPSANPRSV